MRLCGNCASCEVCLCLCFENVYLLANQGSARLVSHNLFAINERRESLMLDLCLPAVCHRGADPGVAT